MQTPGGPAQDPSRPALAGALAKLQSRWGTAAIRMGGDGGAAIPTPSTHGALALAPVPEPAVVPSPGFAPGSHDVISTGFADLDAALGAGGLPRQASAAIRGDVSSGKTTLVLRCIAEAQAGGAIVAWLDLPRAFDPIGAVARGVDLRWLLIVRPKDPAEGFTLAGALLSGRAVDLLVVDLPSVLAAREEHTLRRLSAHARRVGARLLVLEPPTLAGTLHGALAEVTGLRLELEREAWIRLGRDIVGQQTRVTVAKNRYGPPGRHVDVEIHYLDDGERAAAAHRFAMERGADEPPRRLAVTSHRPAAAGPAAAAAAARSGSS
ncbi:MAG: hypothetical protein H0V04_02975 [Chloroflexi bacterium]|nr:hypothetical protein [Chloroflexota bacterium]